MPRTVVVGIDSSTQSTKALLVDGENGEVLESRASPHPPGTAVDPRTWLKATDDSTRDLLDKAEAVSVAGQQHGMIALDQRGDPVFDALLWNDTRSATQAEDLVTEMGGPDVCAATVGSVLVASFTATKLRWLAENQPVAARRVHTVMLPHDFVSWHLSGRSRGPFTDRGDASGTGYFEIEANQWRPDLLRNALGHDAELPELIAGGTMVEPTSGSCPVAGGTGDNMAVALGLGLLPGDVAVSIGTSGVASAISAVPIADGSGGVTCFADSGSSFLPLVTTINAAKVLDFQARTLGVDHHTLGQLAMQSTAGAGGVSILPYYGGERTPNRPQATAVWAGLTDRTTQADLARAAVEALLCSLADAVDALRSTIGATEGRVLLLGGAGRNLAVRALAPSILGQSVHIPPDGEYAALGAARHAAWALNGTDEPPDWESHDAVAVEGEPTPQVRESYAELREATSAWT